VLCHTLLQTGKQISELVEVAHSSGYTEPDPRDDLSGMDVARKALILARTIGFEFEMSDVSVEALYPASLVGAGFS
jgi:homoserine dehydrogenase